MTQSRMRATGIARATAFSTGTGRDESMATYLEHVLHDYGYVAIFAGIGLENMGLPLPGETILITSAIFAATTRCVAPLTCRSVRGGECHAVEAISDRKWSWSAGLVSDLRLRGLRARTRGGSLVRT